MNRLWRDVLFLTLVGAGLLTLAVNLVQPREPVLLTTYDGRAYQDGSFRATVARVDAAFREHWAAQRLTPAPAAPDLAVARRLALGLVGAVPSLEEVRQFEALPEAERLPWWTDRLLADGRFADYFAERFARAFVGTEDGPFILFRRRRFVTWLGEQLAQARPYDEVVRDLIAGTGLWTDRPNTNFVTVTSRPERDNEPDPVRLAGRVARAFLGVRLDCAECHDHPFAEWKQSDFQGLAAFFGQTHVGFTGVYDGSGEFEASLRRGAKQAIAPRVPFVADLLPAEGTRRERLATWVTDGRNPNFARAAVNRVWALLCGRPLTQAVDDLEAEASVPAALEILAEDFAAHGFDLRRLVRLIASTQVFRLDSAADRELTEDDEQAWAAFPLTRLRPEQVIGAAVQASSVTTIDRDSHILVRLVRLANQGDFLKRYGDGGEDEFDGRGGTIPQRLLLMNGTLIHDRVKEGFFNASSRIARVAGTDAHAIETAYLAVLTRRPSAEEAEHFAATLQAATRAQRLADLYWALVNSTEFSWNH